MSFSMVVVLHDSAPEVRRLLESCERDLGDVGAQVICVDSGSHDDGAGLAVARDHGAEIVDLGTNAGFGAANNAGVARATFDVTVLVNPDVVVRDPVSLPALAAFASVHDALHVPRLLNTDGTVQDSAHPHPGSVGHALLAVTHPPALPRRLRDAAQPWRSTEDREVGWAIAAVMSARTSTLRALGPFDPEQFLFYEDLDLCLRARAAGLKTILHPDLVLEHRGRHSTGPAYHGEPHELLARRRREVVRARLGRTGIARDDALQTATFATRTFAARLLRRDPGEAAERLAALRAARRGP
jgi:GT2 family glycosyltransferase